MMYPRLGVLSNSNVFLYSSGSWKFKIKALAGLACLRASLLGL